MTGKVRICQHCHGNGTVTVWNPKKKTYEQIKCPAGCNNGKVNIGTI